MKRPHLQCRSWHRVFCTLPLQTKAGRFAKKEPRTIRYGVSNPVIYLNDTSQQGSFSKSGCLPFLMA